MVLFGDFAHALFYGDRRNGVKIEQSAHRYFDSDQIALRASSRFDIVWGNVNDATTPGAVVELQGTT